MESVHGVKTPIPAGFVKRVDAVLPLAEMKGLWDLLHSVIRVTDEEWQFYVPRGSITPSVLRGSERMNESTATKIFLAPISLRNGATIGSASFWNERTNFES